MRDVSLRLRDYFRSKTQQLLAASSEAVSPHAGLRGTHREEVVGTYLRHILPRRFEIGRGMVHGKYRRSRESDVVIWDSQNYPTLPVPSHNMFFAESVRVGLEIKSRYSSRELNDILHKTNSVRSIVISKEPNLVDEISRLQLEVASLQGGRALDGVWLAPFHIGAGAIVLRGGRSLRSSVLSEEQIRDADDSWPDVLLLLEEGRVVLKQYVVGEEDWYGTGRLLFLEAGKDALLVFTAALLDLITVRSAHLENPLYLSDYIDDLFSTLPSESVDFLLSGGIPGFSPMWSR